LHYFRSREGLIHEVLETDLNDIKTGASNVNYEIKSRRELEKRTEYGRFLHATMQGAMLMGKIESSRQTGETTVREALPHLKSYLVKRKR
jgi:hypothetical protein